MRRRTRAVGPLVASFALAACALQPSPTALPSASVGASPAPSSPPGSPTAAASATATPEPSLALELPETVDARTISVTVEPSIGADRGELLVTVTSTSDERIDELVLRWPTELNDAIFLRPFVPSEDRIRDNGPPLVQAWTKWVVGPGEQGEPDGTVSLGYGPLLPGATLAIALDATRLVAVPVAFDLQLLAANDLLTLTDGGLAELRVEVP
jgi:hypothetical protein